MLETASTLFASQQSTWVPTFLLPGNSLCLTPGSFGLVWNERQLTATGRQRGHKKIRNLCWAVWEMIDMHRRGWSEFLGDSRGVKDPPPSPSAPSSLPQWNLAPKERKKAEKLERGIGSCEYATGQGRKEIAWRRFNQCLGCKIPAVVKPVADTPLHSHGHLKRYAEILQFLQEDKALEKPRHFVSIYESMLIPRLYSG